MIPTPKQSFAVFHADARDELGRQHDKPWFSHAMSHALAQLAWDGATTEQMTGAKRFIAGLSDLCATSEPVAAFPRRTLETFETVNPNPDIRHA